MFQPLKDHFQGVKLIRSDSVRGVVGVRLKYCLLCLRCGCLMMYRMYIKLKSYLLHYVIIDLTLKTNLFVNKVLLSVVYVIVCSDDVNY